MIVKESEQHWEIWLGKWFYKLLFVGIAVNSVGLFTTILEPDGALYASIAKAMAQSGDFINLTESGKDWLDKPHFPFWITAISFKFFGINTFAYKIPAFLFWLMGLYYTYRLALSLYSKKVAQIASLIYITAAHLVISNNDVRAEPYLTGLIVASIFHFYGLFKKQFSWHLVAGSFFAACAVMTKGPFVLITIGAGFILDWLIKGQWKEFLKPKWWIALLLIFIFILPELYCLYLQFDLHPEKIIFNKTSVSGIRFFFWDSQFGRFFNSGPIKGQGDLFFYFHTLLWAFLPWSVLLIAAIIFSIKSFKKNTINAEYITLGALAITFLLFSFSQFQLPHYLNILFPFFSIITSKYLVTLSNIATIKRIKWIQFSIDILLITGTLLLTFFFRLPDLLLIFTWIGSLIFLKIFFFKENNLINIFSRSFSTAIIVYGFLNLFFYPSVLKYQSGSEAAFYINNLKSTEKVIQYGENFYSFNFYIKPEIYFWDDTAIKSSNEQLLIFTKKEHFDMLVKKGFRLEVLQRFKQFHTSQLLANFIYYKTRASVLEEYVVARINPK